MVAVGDRSDSRRGGRVSWRDGVYQGIRCFSVVEVSIWGERCGDEPAAGADVQENVV